MTTSPRDNSCPCGFSLCLQVAPNSDRGFYFLNIIFLIGKSETKNSDGGYYKSMMHKLALKACLKMVHLMTLHIFLFLYYFSFFSFHPFF